MLIGWCRNVFLLCLPLKKNRPKQIITNIYIVSFLLLNLFFQTCHLIFIIFSFIGICVIAYPLIEEIPLAVCYGVFMYLGFSSLSGIQFIEQLKLIFVPSKYHPNRKYIRNVSIMRYTKKKLTISNMNFFEVDSLEF